ncbi:WD repeat domain phosphoinositide-interacting protein 1 isoform X6 [Mastacembelus armatus]|uniref:WD repeat domain phosphoinositide-interacting protein 1 isoform X6 n=1 Tax=Mastacembelus armatus TaxID=205130 RepID=UPI000E463F44|nr:WD repeat domain phosphoinositide-interacting protein 1-like isoform X6 [Mastacembelus armatus]
METAVGAGWPGGPDGSVFGCASFNQDSTSLALGTKTGYKLFSLTMVEKLDCIHESAEIPDVFIVERLFSSSLVVVVSSTMPQRMNVNHFKKGTEICSYSYPNKILAVKLNRQRLVVCLEESVYIHNIKDMKLLKILLNTPSNPAGLCALSINHSNSYLAYPGSATSGEIIVYDAINLGTVIRVFSIPEGLRLFEFRRGMKRYVSISSLSFSPDGQYLSASSNTETVHIFKVEQVGQCSGEDKAATWSAYVGRMFSAASSYLPAQVSGMMSQDRAFATVHLQSSGQKNVCTLAMIQKLPRLLVATADGQLFIYNLDPQDGGECMLAHKHRLFGADEENEGTESEELEATGPPQPCPSYAATAALPASGPVTATLTGYSEDGGAKKGEVIPEHEFAAGPVCLDDENEFPPVRSAQSQISRLIGVVMELEMARRGACDWAEGEMDK